MADPSPARQPTTRSILVGAYAASPAHGRWDPAAEKAFFTALEQIRPEHGTAEQHAVRALELPWLGTLHPHDDLWLQRNFPASVTGVMTDIGYVMSQIGGAGAACDAGTFGLASRSDDGRRAAIDAARRLRDDVARLNDAAGRQAVSAVELHSAPRAHAGSPDALAASLEEVAAAEWDGAGLLLEHCDAEVAGQTPEKGFLPLDAEIAALRSCDAPVGLSLNWGRSAIELRDADRVADQVRQAAESHLLRGLIFSGASDRRSPAGYPWIDAHHAFAASDAHPFGDPTSLLTDERVVEAIRALRAGRIPQRDHDRAADDPAGSPAASPASGDAPWLGVKVGWAHPSGTVEERAALVRDAVHAVQRADAAVRDDSQ